MRPLALTLDQRKALVRALRDQAVFHAHAAECQQFSGYEDYADDDRAQAARLTALAEQIEDTIREVEEKVSA